MILAEPDQEKEQRHGYGKQEEMGGSDFVDVRQPRRDVPGPPECQDGHQKRPAPGRRDQHLTQPIGRNVELHRPGPSTALDSNITWVETPVEAALDACLQISDNPTLRSVPKWRNCQTPSIQGLAAVTPSGIQSRLRPHPRSP